MMPLLWVCRAVSNWRPHTCWTKVHLLRHSTCPLSLNGFTSACLKSSPALICSTGYVLGIYTPHLFSLWHHGSKVWSDEWHWRSVWYQHLSSQCLGKGSNLCDTVSQTQGTLALISSLTPLGLSRIPFEYSLYPLPSHTGPPASRPPP